MAQRKEEYITDAAGKKKAVVIPLKKYLELLEDLHDLAIVAERREEKTLSLEEVKQRLRANRLL